MIDCGKGMNKLKAAKAMVSMCPAPARPRQRGDRVRLADERFLHKSEVPGARFSVFIIRCEPKPENSEAACDDKGDPSH
jgi:hypothetical protein